MGDAGVGAGAGAGAAAHGQPKGKVGRSVPAEPSLAWVVCDSVPPPLSGVVGIFLEEVRAGHLDGSAGTPRPTHLLANGRSEGMPRFFKRQ